MTVSPSAPDTMVLIHGFWVTPRSWEHRKSHYEGRGFRVLAPAYPSFEVEIEALNADPTPVAEVTLPARGRSASASLGRCSRNALSTIPSSVATRQLCRSTLC